MRPLKGTSPEATDEKNCISLYQKENFSTSSFFRFFSSEKQLKVDHRIATNLHEI